MITFMMCSDRMRGVKKLKNSFQTKTLAIQFYILKTKNSKEIKSQLFLAGFSGSLKQFNPIRSKRKAVRTRQPSFAGIQNN